MFLTRIALQNFRSIERLEVDFASSEHGARQLTLLLGENGSGKSSVLKAVALLLAGSDVLGDIFDPVGGWVRNGSKVCRIDGTFALATGQLIEIALEIHRGDSLRDLYSRNEATLAILDSAIAHPDQNYFVLGYGVSRRPNSTARSSTPKFFAEENAGRLRASGLSSLFSADRPLVSLEQWAMDLEYREGANALRLVEDYLTDLLPGVKFRGIDKNHREMMFETDGGVLPLRQLSDSYQLIAAWCGDLLYHIARTFPGKKNFSSLSGLLLIDEVDLRLDPSSLRKMMDFLSVTLPGFQFIVTTHSATTARQIENGAFLIARGGPNEKSRLVPIVGV